MIIAIHGNPETLLFPGDHGPMQSAYRIVTVDATNVGSEGFFCYKSKPKALGYQKKPDWLHRRFGEGLRIKILYGGDRSLGFIEVMPGEHTWRVVEAPGFLIIHCLWVVGKGKGKGYGSALIEACAEEARRQGKLGLVMVSSRGNWLAGEKIFLRNGFEAVGTAPPSFQLLVRRFKAGPNPHFPDDWERRLASFGPGVTVVYSDQCPYLSNAVDRAVAIFQKRGLEARLVRLENAAEARRRSPSAYGVFAVVMDGRLFAYHMLGTKDVRRLDELLERQ